MSSLYIYALVCVSVVLSRCCGEIVTSSHLDIVTSSHCHTRVMNCWNPKQNRKRKNRLSMFTPFLYTSTACSADTVEGHPIGTKAPVPGLLRNEIPLICCLHSKFNQDSPASMAGPCSPTRVVLLCCWLAGSVNASALPPQLKDTNAQPSAAGSHGVRRLAPCSDVEAVSIDFASTTNPAVAMQWTDANGQIYNGSPANGIVGIVPFQTTDTTGGAFPGGSVRWSNLGSDNGVAFDLLVTVPAQPSTYANTVSVTYSSPQSSFSSQAILTAQGYACLGFSLSPSTCLTGAAVDQVTASCADGTPTTLSASEFDFTFVRSGTTTQMPTFAKSFLTFVDVDGDAQTGGNLYELVSVLSAGVLSTTTAASSPLQTGQFSPSGARFAIATQPINVPTDFTVSSATPSAVSLPAIVAFDLRAVSAMKVLLGGRSSVPGQAERGYCFTMAWPAGIDGAQAQPTAPCDVCTDPRETYMIDNGLYCDTWTWAHTNRCNSYQPWRDDPVPQKTCRLSCFLNGNGYDGVSTLWDSHDGTSNCHCLVHRHIQLPLFGTHPSLTAGSHPHLSTGQLLRPGVSAVLTPNDNGAERVDELAPLCRQLAWPRLWRRQVHRRRHQQQQWLELLHVKPERRQPVAVGAATHQLERDVGGGVQPRGLLPALPGDVRGVGGQRGGLAVERDGDAVRQPDCGPDDWAVYGDVRNGAERVGGDAAASRHEPWHRSGGGDGIWHWLSFRRT